MNQFQHGISCGQFKNAINFSPMLCIVEHDGDACNEYGNKWNLFKYPFKIIAEYNNWRQVETFNNISGWIHTQLLSSLKTGLILKTTFLYQSPLKLINPKAKLLPHLLVKIKNCNTKWCKVEIIKNNTYIGWVKKDLIWGATKNNIQ